MKLSEINFGKIDAKHELLGGTSEKKANFAKNFIMPSAIKSFIPNSFVQGDKFIVYGLKGIGKTALLNYLAIDIESREGDYDFFLFKSKFDEDDRAKFAQAARVGLIEENAGEDDANYPLVWKWFVYKNIAKKMESNPGVYFDHSENAKKFIEVVNSVQDQDKDGFNWSKLIPKITKGNVTISKSPSLTLEFSWGSEEKSEMKIKFSEVVRKLEEVFPHLGNNKKNYFLLFDELEFSAGSKKLKRDVSLIKGLIVAVTSMNQRFIELGLGIKIILAVRSDILNKIGARGSEINKTLEDFGVPIKWEDGETESIDHPLIKIITARIKTSIGSNQSDQEIWDRFFSKTMHGMPSEKYILHQTWYKPRDIVRLMNTISQKYGDVEYMSHP